MYARVGITAGDEESKSEMRLLICIAPLLAKTPRAHDLRVSMLTMRIYRMWIEPMLRPSRTSTSSRERCRRWWMWLAANLGTAGNPPAPNPRTASAPVPNSSLRKPLYRDSAINTYETRPYLHSSRAVTRARDLAVHEPGFVSHHSQSNIQAGVQKPVAEHTGE